MKAITKVTLSLIVVFTLLNVGLVHGWSNGGYSTDPTNPKYGTHDWIAQHALDWLPSQEKQYIQDNLVLYLYGTELPDNSQASDGIGDTTKHHVYFSASGQLTDGSSAQRAEAEYNTALNYLKAQDYSDAAKTAGIMTHYIADMGVFGHVMGSSTPWGAEKHHSDYEEHVNGLTSIFSSSLNNYLSFDGSLDNVSAYDATANLAYDTTFGGSSHLSCIWMDNNYDWDNVTFANRSGESLNLAVNAVTDVLYSLFIQSRLSASPTPTPTTTSTAIPTSTPSSTPTPTSDSSPTPTLTPTDTVTPTQSPTPNPTPSASITASPKSTPTIPETPFTILIALFVTAATTMIIIKHRRSGNLAN